MKRIQQNNQLLNLFQQDLLQKFIVFQTYDIVKLYDRGLLLSIILLIIKHSLYFSFSIPTSIRQHKSNIHYLNRLEYNMNNLSKNYTSLIFYLTLNSIITFFIIIKLIQFSTNQIKQKDQPSIILFNKSINNNNNNKDLFISVILQVYRYTFFLLSTMSSLFNIQDSTVLSSINIFLTWTISKLNIFLICFKQIYFFYQSIFYLLSQLRCQIYLERLLKYQIQMDVLYGSIN
ncbi:transmembrane protein, putative (macronuclear) [Tetrahymena thermophila SB210]|uniref:Transmembrane protein, putative n=1 Tax=Tetrahymena thermophila (strain SB210) TaxID=312017 RepID=W7XF91_TETTS|nr:transmembrane protein, putative [Tetrahymena thermophila SB210]EWS76472.1 transmembrane protein, putative [Tetrahymena thermophila SB210]|eukprot:XP_012650995.1 transmembrane protein, putative [Tetrahymena thermophila SB210]